MLESHRLRDWMIAQQRLCERVPPVGIVWLLDLLRRQKERGGHLELEQDRGCNFKIIEIAVIEGECDHAMQGLAARMSRDKFKERNDFVVSAEHLHLADE